MSADDVVFGVTDLPEEQLRDYFDKIIEFAGGKITYAGEPLDITSFEAFYMVHVQPHKESIISLAKNHLHGLYLDYLLRQVPEDNPPLGLTKDYYGAYVIPPEPEGLSTWERIQYYLKRGTGVKNPSEASKRLLLSKIPHEEIFLIYGIFLVLKEIEEKGSRKRGSTESDEQPKSKCPRPDEEISAALIKAKGNVAAAVRLIMLHG
jgi:hypothetical protein